MNRRAFRSERRTVSLLVIPLAGGLSGCIVAGAAAAGAGTGVYLTGRGAESIVNGSVDDVDKRARAVFQQGCTASPGEAAASLATHSDETVLAM